MKIFKHANGKAKGAKNAECLPSMHSATRKKRPCRFAHCIIPEHQPSAGRSGKSKKTEIQSRATGGKKTMKITIEKPGNYTVSDGEEVEVVGTGKGVVIHQSGGYVSTLYSSAPVINMTGGYVWTFGSSAPVINQSGGEVWTFDSSAPVITMTDGYVSTRDSSAPVIHQSEGQVSTWDSSAPVIHKINN